MDLVIGMHGGGDVLTFWSMPIRELAEWQAALKAVLDSVKES